jgi:TolA-binding protein
VRSTIIPALLLVVGSSVSAQPVQAPVQSRALNSTQARADASVVNPTTMQLQMKIQELSSKVDELTSVVQALNGNVASIQTSMTQFRQVSDEQYKKLRATGFLDCYQTAANSTWGYGDGEVAIRHCTGELGPMEKVPF